MDETKTDIVENKDGNNITHLVRNGKAFTIIEHFLEGQTYMDIIKNALRREYEGQ